jgi:hypothetical protein
MLEREKHSSFINHIVDNYEKSFLAFVPGKSGSRMPDW